jgi:hypothetical protein
MPIRSMTAGDGVFATTVREMISGGDAIVGIADVASSTSSGAIASVGAGLYLVVIGGLAAVVGVFLYRPEPQQKLVQADDKR